MSYIIKWRLRAQAGQIKLHFFYNRMWGPTFLDFVTFGPLILRMRLSIMFLFVGLQFRYPFFSPAPHDINLGSRFEVRRQLRPGGLSPQTDGMPVIPKKECGASTTPHYLKLKTLWLHVILERHYTLAPSFEWLTMNYTTWIFLVCKTISKINRFIILIVYFNLHKLYSSAEALVNPDFFLLTKKAIKLETIIIAAIEPKNSGLLV